MVIVVVFMLVFRMFIKGGVFLRKKFSMLLFGLLVVILMVVILLVRVCVDRIGCSVGVVLVWSLILLIF